MTAIAAPGDRFMRLDDLSPHPDRDLVPALTSDEYEALLIDVRENGVLVPLIASDGVILDGHNRHRAAIEAGLDEVPVIRLYGLSDDEQLERLVKLNANRRQLTRDQKREMAVKLRAKGWTQDRISAVVAVPRRTVGDWLNDERLVEDVGEIANVSLPETVTDTLGREQPATKERTPKKGPLGISQGTGEAPKYDKLGPMRALREAQAESWNFGEEEPTTPRTTVTEATRPKPEPSREEQERTSRGNAYASIGRLVAFAHVVQSDKNIEHYTALLIERREEFYTDQRYTVEQILKAGEEVIEGLPLFLAKLKEKMTHV